MINTGVAQYLLQLAGHLGTTATLCPFVSHIWMTACKAQNSAICDWVGRAPQLVWLPKDCELVKNNDQAPWLQTQHHLPGFQSKNLNRRHTHGSLQENKEKLYSQKVSANSLGICNKYCKYWVGLPNPLPGLVNIKSEFGCVVLAIDKPGATGLRELPVSCQQLPLPPCTCYHLSQERKEQRKKAFPVEVDIKKRGQPIAVLDCCSRSNLCSAELCLPLCGSHVSFCVFFIIGSGL